MVDKDDLKVLAQLWGLFLIGGPIFAFLRGDSLKEGFFGGLILVGLTILAGIVGVLTGAIKLRRNRG